MSIHKGNYTNVSIKNYSYFYYGDIMIANETRQILEKHNVNFSVGTNENIISNTIIIVGLLDANDYSNYNNDFIQLLIKYGKNLCDYAIKHPHDSRDIISFLLNINNYSDLLQIVLNYYYTIIMATFNNNTQCIYHLFKNTDMCSEEILRLTLSKITLSETYKYIVVAHDKKNVSLVGELMAKIIDANGINGLVDYLNELNEHRVSLPEGTIDLMGLYASLPPKYDSWKLGVII